MKKLIILFLIFLTACTPQPKIEELDVAQECIGLCKQQTIDLGNGPCLSNNLADDWVCDVAHDPREAIDNLPENQCSAFREGKANHFVEVTPDCELIRKV
ncbi:MAG: hypothetical protein AABX55_00125 [Nanoarchaeota archaeon]